MLTPIPQSRMQATLINPKWFFGGLLLVAHQDSPALTEPTQRALLLHPTPRRRVPFLASGGIDLLLAAGADV